VIAKAAKACLAAGLVYHNAVAEFEVIMLHGG
jgi:hypothetical protein